MIDSQNPNPNPPGQILGLDGNPLIDTSRLEELKSKFGETVEDMVKRNASVNEIVKSVSGNMSDLTKALIEAEIKINALTHSSDDSSKELEKWSDIQIRLNKEIANTIKKTVPQSHARLKVLKDEIEITKKSIENLKKSQSEEEENAGRISDYNAYLREKQKEHDRVTYNLVAEGQTRRFAVLGKFYDLTSEKTKALGESISTHFGQIGVAGQKFLEHFTALTPAFLIANSVLKVFQGSMNRLFEFSGTMQQFGGVTSRVSDTARIRQQVLTGSIGSFLSAKESQELYTTAVNSHLYVLANVNDMYDEYGNRQRMAVDVSRELANITASVSFSIQQMGKTLGMTNEQSIKVGSELFNRFNIEIGETSEYFNLLIGLAEQMQVSFVEFFEPISGVAEQLRFMDVSFENIIGDSRILMDAMDNLSMSGERFWKDVTPDQRLKIFSEGVQRLFNISKEMVIAWRGGLGPGQSLGEAFVDAFEMGPLTKGILGVRKAFEMGLGQFGETAEQQAAVIGKMIGLEGREGLRITQALMAAADKLEPEQLVKMTQPELLDELQSLTAMTMEEREALGRTMNAASKEPLKHITELIEKIIEIITNIASSSLLNFNVRDLFGSRATPVIDNTATGVGRFRIGRGDIR